MSQLQERRTHATTRPVPDEAVLSGPRAGAPAVLRMLGAIAVLAVGVVHLEQYFAEHFDKVSVIGPLFLLNFVGATVIGLGLLLPSVRVRRLHPLLALGGIGLAATSIVFLFISEHQPLFGFQEAGYRAAVVIALAAEAVAVLALTAYLAMRARSRA
jgi:hypothetical protein